MALTLKIDNVDFTASTQEITIQPGELGDVGKVTVKLLLGSAPAIKDKAKLDLYDGAYCWCIGFLAHRKSTVVKGTTKLLWTLTFQDCNLAFDRVVYNSPSGTAQSIAAAKFHLQIADIVAKMQGLSPAPTLAIYTGAITDLASNAAGPAVTLPAFSITSGSNLRSVLDTVMTNALTAAKAVNAATVLSARYYMRYIAGSPILPTLDCYNELLSASAYATFSYAPVGGEIGLLEFERDIDGIDKVEKRQINWGGGFVTGTLSNTTDTSRNLLMGDGYWSGKRIDQTYGTAALAQAAIDAEVKDSSENIETIRIKTNTRIPPGKYVRVKWSPESFDKILRVAAVSINFSAGGKVEYYQLTLNEQARTYTDFLNRK